MKRGIHTLLLAMIIVNLFGQAPQGFNYQAVLRTADGELLDNQNLSLTVNILKGSTQGQTVFTETHNTTTNAFGLVNLIIGSVNSLEGMNWGSDAFFVEILVNDNPMGVSQLLSVPYALHTKSHKNVTPRIGQRHQTLSVSFSGGDNLNFSQASPTCPDLHAHAILQFTQGSPTTIYPAGKYYIDNKRFDLIFNIPWYAPSGLYNIVISPDSECPYTMEESFRIIE